MNAAHEIPQSLQGIHWAPVRWAFAGSLIVALIVFYQAGVNAEWHELPAASDQTVDSTEARLVALNDLMERNPIWIGAFEGVKERSRLSATLVQLKTKEAIEQAQETGEQELSKFQAAGERQSALEFLKAGDLESAREKLVEALDVAPEGWAESEQVRLDIEAIDEELEVNR